MIVFFSRIRHLLGIPSHLCETRAPLHRHRYRSSNLIETYKELLLVSRFLFTDKLLLPMKFDFNGFHCKAKIFISKSGLNLMI